MLKQVLSLLFLVLFFNSNVQAIDEVIISPQNSYTIKKELGKGAFCNVLSVENHHGEKFAMKTFHPEGEIFAKPGDLEREFTTGQTLNHPIIIKTFELFSNYDASNNEIKYLVLELVDGPTYANLPDKSLSKSVAIRNSIQFIDALQHALSLDYLYTDPHSNNIMMNDASDLKIIDIGSFFKLEELYSYACKEAAIRNGIMMQRDDLEISPIQEKKLKAFFKQNPRIFDQIDMQGVVGNKKVDRSEIAVHLEIYVYKIIYTCLDSIIIKSDMRPKEQKALKVEIDKILKKYEKKAEREDWYSVNKCFGEIVELLQSNDG